MEIYQCKKCGKVVVGIGKTPDNFDAVHYCEDRCRNECFGKFRLVDKATIVDGHVTISMQ